jgi:hypothetical protein
MKKSLGEGLQSDLIRIIFRGTMTSDEIANQRMKGFFKMPRILAAVSPKAAPTAKASGPKTARLVPVPVPTIATRTMALDTTKDYKSAVRYYELDANGNKATQADALFGMQYLNKKILTEGGKVAVPAKYTVTIEF